VGPRGPTGLQVFLARHLATAFTFSGYGDVYLPVNDQVPGENRAQTIQFMCGSYLGFQPSTTAARYTPIMAQSVKFAAGARTGRPCHLTICVEAYEMSADEVASLQLNHGSDGKHATIRQDDGTYADRQIYSNGEWVDIEKVAANRDGYYSPALVDVAITLGEKLAQVA
jgi:hypothetical protein